MTLEDVERTLGFAWSQGPTLVPVAAAVVACLFAGYPIKHRKLPPLDMLVIVSMSALTVYQGLDRLLKHIPATAAGEEVDALGCLVYILAGLTALHRSLASVRRSDDPAVRDEPPEPVSST